MRQKKATYCKIYTYAPELRYNNYLRRPPQLERLEQPVQRGLRRVVPRVNRTQDVRIRHPRALAELLDAHGPNHLSEGGLDRQSFHPWRQEGTRVRTPGRAGPVPVLRSNLDCVVPCHVLSGPDSLANSPERGGSGNRNPRLGTVTKIASACGVTLRFVQRGSMS